MDELTLMWRFSFLIEAVVLLFVAKLFRDLLLLRRGYRVDQQITESDNLAASIDLSGFLLGTVIALLDSFVIEGHSWLTQSSEIAYTGLIVLALMGLNSWITDLFIFRGIDDHKEINEQRNISIACGRAGAMIATGFIIRAAFGHPNSWLICVLWALVGQASLILMAYVYQWISPYDDLAEIKKGNVAAGLPMMGVLIAVGITIESAIFGESVSWTEELISVGLYLLIGALLLFISRWLFNKIFLPKGDLDHEIVNDQNIGVGLLEATLYISLAEVINFFLN